MISDWLLPVVAVAIDLNPDYVRALLRRAELHEQTEKLDEALEDYKKVLELDPSQTSARQACMVSSLTPGTHQTGTVSLSNCLSLYLSVSQRLPQQIQERNEKLKEEMMSTYCT